MNNLGFTPSNVTNNFFTDNVPASKRGKTFSVKDTYGPRQQRAFCNDAKIHDANFAFLTTTLAKLHKTLYEPKYFVTWTKDIPAETGGGFVDYVEYYTVDWAGIMSEFRNVVGNNANYIPRVNAGMTQKRVNVFTFEVAYDLRFIELEKMKKLQLQKSIQEIYQNAITAQWDLFVQKVAYTGLTAGTSGLFNSDDKVLVSTIDNATDPEATGLGFEGMSDDAVVSFFNGVFATYLKNSNMNIGLLPDTFLVPTFVGADLVSRFSPLYTDTLRNFIQKHNLGNAEAETEKKIRIVSRPDLDELGIGKAGRIVVYKNDKTFVRLDIPYPMQHYVTLPNIDKMSYTSAFVGQVSEVQMPYNTSNTEFGVVTYWDFTGRTN